MHEENYVGIGERSTLMIQNNQNLHLIFSVYSGVKKESKYFCLTSAGLSTIDECTRNPPVDEYGNAINVLTNHLHDNEDSLFKEVLNVECYPARCK